MVCFIAANLSIVVLLWGLCNCVGSLLTGLAAASLRHFGVVVIESLEWSLFLPCPWIEAHVGVLVLKGSMLGSMLGSILHATLLLTAAAGVATGLLVVVVVGTHLRY